jgi:cell division protein FtsN
VGNNKRRGSASDEYPGWAWMLFGLGIGLSVALAIYVNAHHDRAAKEPVAQEPASLSTPLQEAPPAQEGLPGQEGPPAQEESTAATNTAEAPKPRFDFYKMLPNFEVIIPEEEKEVSTDTTEKAVMTPGVYVLQVGSFTNFADADRRRAQLALQGIESAIQRVVIDGKAYHRVRIGPIDDLERLNLLRSRLRAADIDVLRIRLSE